MICIICNKEFEQKHFNQRYCSEECSKEAKRISKRKYKNSEKGKLSNERWVKSNRRKENEKKYRSTDEARKRAVIRQKRYLENHPEAREKKRERAIKYGHTEKYREINRLATKKYRKSEKGKIQSRKNKYLRRSGEQVDKTVIEELMAGNVCYYCGNVITESNQKTIDHKTPITRGGDNSVDNLVLACRHCNCQKNNKTEKEYMGWLNENKDNV